MEMVEKKQVKAVSEGLSERLVYFEPNEIKMNERFRKDLGDLSDLKESIKLLGLLQPIGITKDGSLVFGERRLKAWVQLGFGKIPCVFVDGDIYTQKLKEFHENVKRKDMTWQEEVLALEEIKQTYEKLHGWTKQGERTDLTLSSDDKVNARFNQEQLASELRIAQSKISQDLQLAKAIKQYPEIRKCVTKKSALKKLKQIQYVQTLEKHDFWPDGVTLFLGDFREKGLEIKAESVNVIIVDPPYGQDYLELWDSLAELAFRVLVPSGYLITYSGQAHLPIILEKLRAKIEYFWTIALNLKERNLVYARNVYNKWKPILVFYKPPLNLPIQYFNDVINGQGREKEFDNWQQAENELYEIIETFCPSNGVILDPMAGTGTTLMAAQKLKRKCIGIEKDESMFKIMENRIRNVAEIQN
jgi:ParB-like chromosome segregation protein Spo0J